MGVFAVTCCFSLLAYIWMFIVLQIWTPGYVTLIEASLTFFFFFLLICLAFTADKINAIKKKREASDEEKQ